MPDPNRPGSLMHAQTLINGRALMMTDHGMEDTPPSRNFGHLQLVVADGEAWWSRAVAAGCTVLMPFETQFWGDRFGVLVDPFGLKWGILQPAGAPGCAGGAARAEAGWAMGMMPVVTISGASRSWAAQRSQGSQPAA